MTRLEGVTQGVGTNGYISERTGDGLVSQRVSEEVAEPVETGGGEVPSEVVSAVSRGPRKKTDLIAEDRRPLKKLRLSAGSVSPQCLFSIIL